MKRCKVRYFILGMVCAVLLMSMIGTALATSGTKTASLLYDNIKITLNGNQLTPKDANGKTVEPFIIDGTTYLPVRAIAEAMELNVEWDGANNTAVLSTKNAVSKGQTLVDRDGIKITFTGVSERDFPGEVNIKVLIENNSSQPICVQTRDQSVNGYMISPIFSCSVEPGKKANDEISFFKSDLEQNGIEKINDVELKFLVFNDTTRRDLFKTDAITIVP